jgi:hypothetical protein
MEQIKNEEGIEPIKPKILHWETYLKMVENSEGSRLFNSVIVEQGGQKVDLLNDGELSCATFVSNILYLNHFLSVQKTSVDSLEKVMLESLDFEVISPADYEPQVGDVVFWEKIIGEDGVAHRHVGLVLNEQEAISTSSASHQAIRHPLYKKPATGIDRQIERIFRYKKGLGLIKDSK